jgi:hypothetical protein
MSQKPGILRLLRMLGGTTRELWVRFQAPRKGPTCDIHPAFQPAGIVPIPRYPLVPIPLTSSNTADGEAHSMVENEWNHTFTSSMVQHLPVIKYRGNALLYEGHLKYYVPLWSGFGGLGVSVLASGSNPAEAVGFYGWKNPQHAFLRKGSKAAGPMSQICGM